MKNILTDKFILVPKLLKSTYFFIIYTFYGLAEDYSYARVVKNV